jgi:MFS family permease
VRALSGGLWRHPDFLKLWAGQTVSLLGSQVTALALPLTAVLTLEAGPIQMGLLGVAGSAPFLLIGLLAGVWVDRLRRRPILIGADVGRALLLGSIPVAALLGLLRIEQLYLVAFLVGILTVFFDVAYQAFLPALVPRARLVEGNSKLEASRSIAQIAGPGLGGGLVQLVTAPVTLVADALSFLGSALFLALIRAPETAPTSEARASVWREIGEGLRVVLGNRLLRAIAGCTGTWNLFSNVMFAVLVLYATRELGIEPAVLGPGRTIVGAALFGSATSLLIPLAQGPAAVVVALLTVAHFLMGLSVVYNITQVSLRQAIIPDRLQGRMNATMRFLVWGTLPMGSLIGGVLGETIGLRPTLVVGALGSLLASVWLLFSPLRHLRDHPVPATDPTASNGDRETGVHSKWRPP